MRIAVTYENGQIYQHFGHTDHTCGDHGCGGHDHEGHCSHE